MMPSLHAMPSWFGRLFLCGCAAFNVARAAEESPAVPECPSTRTTPLAPRPPARTSAPSPTSTGPTRLRADTMQSLNPDVIELKGNAEVDRDAQRIRSNYLRYDRSTNNADASGGVSLTTPNGAQFKTEELQFNLDTHVGFMGPGTYIVPSKQGRGDMARAEFLDADRTQLFDVRFTTCPPGNDDWAFKMRRLDLDTAEDVGVARGTTLEFLGLPLLYLPYLRFPISDERKSGFLVPQLGYSSKLGGIVGAPYYLNLAPNYDATVTPRVLGQRGLQMQGEFRYLGRDLRGELDIEHLINDRVTGENRAAGTFIHQQAFNPYWSTSVNVRGVSDKDYLSDFGDRLGVTSESHLLENAEVNYRGSLWTFTARAADYQTVDRSILPADRPYARLPQLLLAGNSGPTATGLQYRLDSEAVNFHRDASLTGSRLNVAPAINLPLRRPYGFLTPEIGVRHIAYALNDAPESHPSVTAPFVSLDSGLYFEREARWGNSLFDHTLEPRLYYLYVPTRAQDQLPNFDTALREFTFANLFRNNRFIGGDRIGDANQLTAALTTRVLDQASGTEQLRASIGRTYFFDERRVNLPSANFDDAASDLAAEVTAWLPNHWHARAAVQRVPELNENARFSFYTQYQPAPNKILNLGYRFLRDQTTPVVVTGIEQVDISAEWPLSAAWTLRGRTLYSLRENDRGNVESFIGAQYNSCCWAVRLYAARRLIPATAGSTLPTEQSNHISIEFELTGLSRSNGRFESPLRQSLFSFPASAPGGYAPAR